MKKIAMSALMVGALGLLDTRGDLHRVAAQVIAHR
ncbi:hypothetical protein ABIB68_007970 [Bradyrhizobium sp. F1.2.2]